MYVPAEVHQILDQAFLVDLPELGYSPLGPDYKKLTGNRLHESLISHRILNKYEVPDKATENMRKEVSIMKMLHADSIGMDTFDYRTLNPESRHDFLVAKGWLNTLFKGFRRAYSLRFPSNETFVTSRGMTDLFFKLSEANQWLVSPDCVEDCVQIILRHRALLNIVKRRYAEEHGVNGKQTLRNLRESYVNSGLPMKQLRYWMVKFMFRATTKLHRTARVTAIEKNNRSSRVITLEALWNMVAQLSYASDVRSLLVTKLGYDLTFLQDVHRSLIRSGKSTIDLSSASDSNWVAVLQQLLPKRVFSDLNRLRTGILERHIDGEHTYHPLNMLAPMGCGFTFEIMTVVLLAHCRALDCGSSVFGDDIIIKEDMAARLIRNLEAQGWVINQEKSFTEGNFRESCGAFCDLSQDKLLLSYDIKRPTTIPELCLVMSKIWNLGHALNAGPLRQLFAELYANVVKVIRKDLLLVEPGPARLREDVIYIPNALGPHIVTRTTKITKYLSSLFQRRIEVSLSTVYLTNVRKSPLSVGPYHYACFMRRGMTYDVPYGRVKAKQVQIDKWSGSPLRDFHVDLEVINF